VEAHLKKFELMQLRRLKTDKQTFEEQIEILESMAERVNVQLSDMPHENFPNDRIGKLVAEITDLKDKLAETAMWCDEEHVKLTKFILKIKDLLAREILKYRYIDGLTWRQIANRIGGNTEENVRKIHSRFLKNLEDE
jgi:DNA-directed RNA polymerase specialized sigma subunit